MHYKIEFFLCPHLHIEISREIAGPLGNPLLFVSILVFMYYLIALWVLVAW